MKELYLHIGYPKTGTTAIQESLYLNRIELIDRGVLYPETGIEKYAHHQIPWVFNEDKRSKGGTIGAITDGIQKELDKNERVEKVVVSSEGFIFAMSPEDVKGIFDDMFESIKLVVYLRQPLRWIKSDYNQGVKGWRQLTCDFNEHLNRVLLIKKCPMDYYSLLSEWAAVFGWGNMVVRTFDMERDSLVKGFLDILGVRDHAGLKQPERRDSNPRLSNEQVELLRFVNSLDVSLDDRSLLLEKINKIGDKHIVSSGEKGRGEFYYKVDKKRLNVINKRNKMLLRHFNENIFDSDFFDVRGHEKSQNAISQIEVKRAKEIIEPLIEGLLND